MIQNVLSILSLLLLAAHGLRAANIGITLFWLTGVALALSPHKWKNYVLAVLLGFGSWLWADRAYDLAQIRMESGFSWARLALILGSISLFTLFAAIINFRKAILSDRRKNLPGAISFLLTLSAILLVRQKAPYDMLLPDRFLPGGGLFLSILLGWYGAFIVTKMLDPLSTAKWRLRIWTFFSSVFFLQLALGLVGFEHFLMTGKLHLPIPALIAAGPVYRGDGFFMINLFAATLVLAGPAWCSHLCYIGAWDNLASRTKKRLLPLPGWVTHMRRLICVAVLGLAYLLGKSGIAVSIAVFAASSFGILGVLLMFVWSRRAGLMTHCIAYCPMGILANIFGKINPWRIRIADGCNRCGLCSRYCRYDALTPIDVKNRKAGLTCSLCGDCISICADEHLHYNFLGYSGETARTWFIVVTVSLHAVFLGVARL